MSDPSLNVSIFVINLPESKMRRANVIKEMQRIDLPFEFFDGVDGKKLDLANDKLIDYEAVLKTPLWLTPGMIGCSLSHAKLYEEIIKRNIDIALIMEDDSTVPDDYKEVIQSAAKSLHTNEIIMFYFIAYGGCKFSKQGIEKLTDKYALVYPMEISRPISTTAYMINKETCKKLIKILYPISSSPDSWGVFYEKKAIDCIRCIYPMPVKIKTFRSTIGYTKPNSILGAILKFIDDYHVFPFHQLLNWKRNKLVEGRRNFIFVEEKSKLQK